MAFPGGGAMGPPMNIGGGGAQGGLDPQQAQQQMMVKYVRWPTKYRLKTSAANCSN